MLDENEAPDTDEVEDTPTDEVEETPTEDTSSDTSGDDWEERYNALQPEFTRKSQRLSEVEGENADLEARLAELEGQLQDDDGFDDEESEDPYGDRLDRIEQLFVQQLEQEQAVERTQQEHAYIAGEIDRIAEAMGEKFSEAEDQAIGRLAQTMRDDQGNPDVKGAAKLVVDGILKARRKSWADVKRSATRPSQGGAAIDKIDPTDPKQRESLLAQRVAELDAVV